jgi:hypothetical protein
VVGCAFGFADTSLSLASHEDVLVVAQPLGAGRLLSSSDLRPVRVSTGTGPGGPTGHLGAAWR